MHSNGYRGLLQGRKFSAGAGGVDQKRHSKSPLGLSGSTRLKNGACCGVAGSDRDPNASRLRDRKKNTVITTQGHPCRSGSFKGGLGSSLSYVASASLPGGLALIKMHDVVPCCAVWFVCKSVCKLLSRPCPLIPRTSTKHGHKSAQDP